MISKAFGAFFAVLGDEPTEMISAYLAEVNLGIDGFQVNEERVRFAIAEILSNESLPIEKGTRLYCKGNAYLALNELEDARDTFLEAIDFLQDPRLSQCRAMCLKNLGSVFEDLGEEDSQLLNTAKACYEQAIAADTTLSEAHFALGTWYVRFEDDAELALEHLDSVTEGNRSSIKNWGVQGWRCHLLFRAGDFAGAFREINNLLADAKTSDWVLPWCARQVFQYGRSNVVAGKKSVAFWNRYLSIEPDDMRAKRELFVCQVYLAMLAAPVDLELDHSEELVKLLIEEGDPDPAYLWDRLGHVAQCEGDWEAAASYYEQAYQLEPRAYGYCYGTALSRIERFSEALPILELQAEEVYQDGLGWNQVAHAREGLKDIEGAIDAYKTAIELEPENVIAWFNLGGMYLNVFESELAKSTWAEAIERFPDHELALKVKADYSALLAPH